MSGDFKHSLKTRIEQTWYGKSGLTLFLRPLSWLFVMISRLRRLAYKTGIKRQITLDVPVIIIGNLTVGGTGKTPLVIWLANYLKQAGYKPGILSRGYGGQARHWPQQVRPDADPIMVGDEAVVIARRTQCPMAVGPSRVAAGQALLKYADVDVILSDDGLQHYALARDIEVLVIDGIRRFGNGLCLPAGPLRECPERQHEVDCKVTNGIAAQDEYAMQYRDAVAVNLLDHSERELSDFIGKPLHAIAGIGNPDRFFNFLRSKGLRMTSRAYPDHYLFTPETIDSGEASVLMTEKDAVKCQRFARDNWWYINAEVQLPDEFGQHIIKLLETSHG